MVLGVSAYPRLVREVEKDVEGLCDRAGPHHSDV